MIASRKKEVRCDWLGAHGGFKQINEVLVLNLGGGYPGVYCTNIL